MQVFVNKFYILLIVCLVSLLTCITPSYAEDDAFALSEEFRVQVLEKKKTMDAAEADRERNAKEARKASQRLIAARKAADAAVAKKESARKSANKQKATRITQQSETDSEAVSASVIALQQKRCAGDGGVWNSGVCTISSIVPNTSPITSVGEETASSQDPVRLIIPSETSQKYPKLVRCVVETHSMNNQERNYWLQVLPVMTNDQVNELVNIMNTERKKLAEIQAKYSGNAVTYPASCNEYAGVIRMDEASRRVLDQYKK